MLDKNLIREHPDIVRRSLQRRNLSVGVAEEALAIDGQWRTAATELDHLKAERNRISAEFAKAKDGGPEALAALRQRSNALGAQIQQLEHTASELEQRLNQLLAGIPNVLAADVPDGADEKANVEVRRWGEPPAFPFSPKAHW